MPDMPGTIDPDTPSYDIPEVEGPVQQDTIGSFPDPVAGPSLIAPVQQDQNHFTVYFIDTIYDWAYQKKQMPVAISAPGGFTTVAAEVTTAAPTCRKVVKWTCERIGAKPILPGSATGSSNEILVFKRISPMSPLLTPDGTRQMWRASGLYVYDLKVPPDHPDGTGAVQSFSLPTGAPPPDVTAYPLQTLDSTQFDNTILRVPNPDQ